MTTDFKTHHQSMKRFLFLFDFHLRSSKRRNTFFLFGGYRTLFPSFILLCRLLPRIDWFMFTRNVIALEIDRLNVSSHWTCYVLLGGLVIEFHSYADVLCKMLKVLSLSFVECVVRVSTHICGWIFFFTACVSFFSLCVLCFEGEKKLCH